MGGRDTGWVDHGDWIINRMPDWLIPPSLINTTVTLSPTRYFFDPRYRDPDGWPNLDVLYFAITKTLPTGEMGPNAVYFECDQGENKIYLANDEGTGWLGGLTAGTVGYIDNSKVRVVAEWSKPGIQDVKTRVMRWPVGVPARVRGLPRVYMRAIDQFPGAGGDTGWKWKGTLTPSARNTSLLACVRSASQKACAT